MRKATFFEEINETDIEIEFDEGVFGLIDNFNNKHVVFDKITAEFIVNFIKLNIGDI